MADKRGRVYDPVKGAERKRKQRADPDKRAVINEQQNRSYKKHHGSRLERMRESWFWTQYGITVQEKDQMVLDCGGICPICLNAFKDRRDTHLDHDHETGRVRGVLCGSCNRKLGWYEKHLGRVNAYLTRK